MSAIVEQALKDHVFITEYTTREGKDVRYEDSGWYAWQEAPIGEAVEVDRVGSVTVVEFDDEDHRDYERKIHFIFRVEDAAGVVTHFKKDGFYQSYSGSDWDGDFYEVNQVEKTVLVWDKV